MTDDTRLAIMAEIAACVPKPLQPHEFTIKQYADANGLNYSQAKTIIARMERAGTLKVRALHDKAYAYWRPKDVEHD